MSQCAAILLYLQSGHALTPIEALNLFGCLRLAARIEDLRREGHAIDTAMIEGDGKRWASYRLRLPVQPDLFSPSMSTAIGSGSRAGTHGGVH